MSFYHFVKYYQFDIIKVDYMNKKWMFPIRYRVCTCNHIDRYKHIHTHTCIYINLNTSFYTNLHQISHMAVITKNDICAYKKES